MFGFVIIKKGELKRQEATIAALRDEAETAGLIIKSMSFRLNTIKDARDHWRESARDARKRLRALEVELKKYAKRDPATGRYVRRGVDA